MDRMQIYRTTSLEYRMLKLMFCECLFYAFFLSCLTTYIINVRPSNVYEARRQQLDYWGGCKRGTTGIRGEGSCIYSDNVTDHGRLMDWMIHDFTPKAFTDQDL